MIRVERFICIGIGWAWVCGQVGLGMVVLDGLVFGASKIFGFGIFYVK